ncbi:MAG: class E sortase [Actinobacteria bacterium]|nr:class E sortase [Actinomycetota bacterium]
MIMNRQIGEIDSPRIGLLFWISQGTSKQSMTAGAGHIDGTPLPGAGGSFAIAGDRVLYGAPFLKLDQVRAGDKVILRMPYAGLTYQVSGVTKVPPDDVSVLDLRGDDSITLSTCDPVWRVDQRIIVSGRLINLEVKPW